MKWVVFSILKRFAKRVTFLQEVVAMCKIRICILFFFFFIEILTDIEDSFLFRFKITTRVEIDREDKLPWVSTSYIARTIK